MNCKRSQVLKLVSRSKRCAAIKQNANWQVKRFDKRALISYATLKEVAEL